MTAEEFFRNSLVQSSIDEDGSYSLYDIESAMIEFAKYHVERALQYALDEVPYGGSDEIHYEDVEGILTCYPLENIK